MNAVDLEDLMEILRHALPDDADCRWDSEHLVGSARSTEGELAPDPEKFPVLGETPTPTQRRPGPSRRGSRKSIGRNVLERSGRDR